MINFPNWVTDASAAPPAVLVKAKKLMYVFIAAEKLRILHNAVGKWYRGESLNAAEESLLASKFSSQWPTPPTETQINNWMENYWEPRQDAVQDARTLRRRAIVSSEFSHVNLDDLI